MKRKMTNRFLNQFFYFADIICTILILFRVCSQQICIALHHVVLYCLRIYVCNMYHFLLYTVCVCLQYIIDTPSFPISCIVSTLFGWDPYFIHFCCHPFYVGHLQRPLSIFHTVEKISYLWKRQCALHINTVAQMLPEIIVKKRT